MTDGPLPLLAKSRTITLDTICRFGRCQLNVAAIVVERPTNRL
jgi:hypothetical protein